MQSEGLQSQRKFTVAELMQRDNMVLETINNDFDGDEDEDEAFGLYRNRDITSQEMLKYLNIEGDADEENNAAMSGALIVGPCGTSFETLKLTMTDISEEGKVFKSIKQPGVGEVVPRDAEVTIHYMGYFEYQDEPFDSSCLRQNRYKIRLNEGALIVGLEMGIQTMKKHEIAHFIIHPDYGFGPMGCPPRVPPNEEVMFAVHLLDYTDNAEAATYKNLDKEQRKSLAISFPIAMAFHVTANDDFKRNRLRQAVKGYKKVISILDEIRLENQEEQDQQQKALTKAMVNLGICHNNLKEPLKACITLRNVPIPSAKAFFQLGKALMSIGEYDKAMQEMHKAKSLEPNNRAVVKQIQELNERMRQYKLNEKKLWSKCLSVKKENKEMSEFAHYAREICESLLNNEDLMRQNLQAGLNDKELECFKEQAATLGLSFTMYKRFGKIEYYICKSNYENHRRG